MSVQLYNHTDPTGGSRLPLLVPLLRKWVRRRDDPTWVAPLPAAWASEAKWTKDPVAKGNGNVVHLDATSFDGYRQQVGCLSAAWQPPSKWLRVHCAAAGRGDARAVLRQREPGFSADQAGLEAGQVCMAADTFIMARTFPPHSAPQVGDWPQKLLPCLGAGGPG